MLQADARHKKRKNPPPKKSKQHSSHQIAGDAWLASLGIHGLILLLILLFAALTPPVAPTSQPIELVDINANAPVGDRKAVASDRPAPKHEAAPVVPLAAHDQRATHNQVIKALKHADLSSAPAKTPRVHRPDVAALLAMHEKEESKQDAARIGELAAGDPGLDPQDGNAPQTAAQLQGGAVDNGSGLTGDLGKRQILDKVEPTYPDSARREGIEGDVRLKVWVNADGLVNRVEIVQFSGTPALDRQAMKALRQWRFAPLPASAAPVTQWGEITMHFRLE